LSQKQEAEYCIVLACFLLLLNQYSATCPRDLTVLIVGPQPPRRGAFSGWGRKRQRPGMDDSCEYVACDVGDGRQGVVLHRGGSAKDNSLP
jgi:hypothetical protein